MTSYRRYFIALVLTTILGAAWTPCSHATLPKEPPAESGTAAHEMTYVQAAILGIVEGVTEYLPVSSTGHLLLAQRIMGIGGGIHGSNPQSRSSRDAADAYAICIQAGAILAVLGLYAKRVRQMILGLSGRDPEGLRMVVNLVAAFFPAAIMGLLLHKAIKTYLFGPWPIILAWFVGGLAILWIERRRKTGPSRSQQGKSLSSMNLRMALVIGIVQCIAMWPGVSRSLSTILGGIMVGLSTPAAVEFSFLLGVITLGAATLFDALKHGREMMEAYNSIALMLGLGTAFLSAVISVKWMVGYLNRHGLEIFGYYRMAVAALAAALMLAGWI